MPVDPKSLLPGTVIRHKDGDTLTLDRRKDDDSGWWMTDRSGLVDWIWADTCCSWEVLFTPPGVVVERVTRWLARVPLRRGLRLAPAT